MVWGFGGGKRQEGEQPGSTYQEGTKKDEAAEVKIGKVDTTRRGV